MWDSGRRLLLLDGDKLVTSGRTSLEAGTQGAPEDLTLPCSGELFVMRSLLCLGKLPFVQDGVGCEGLRLRGEEEGRAVPLDPAEEDYQRRTVQEKRPVPGTCWGGGWAEAGGAAPLSSSFALKTKKVHGDDCEWKDVKSCISGSVQRKSLVARPPATGEGLPTPAAGTQRPRAAGPRGRLRKAWSRAGPRG